MRQTRQHLVEAIYVRSKKLQDKKVLASEIAAYLLTENRVDELEPLVRDLVQYQINQGDVEASVVSAHELTDEVYSDIKKILHEEFPDAKKINVIPKVNPELVGGVRVELPNEQLDLSLRRRLALFKSHVMIGKD